MKIKVYLDYERHLNAVSMWIVGIKENGNRVFVKPVDMTFEEVEEGAYREPTFRFDRHFADEFLESLAGELINMGYRPDELKAKEGELTATKYHLEDMRKIALEEKHE